MANAEAWNQGWALGSERAAESRAHKQAMSDAEFQDKHNEIQGMIDNLSTRLSTMPKGSIDYLKTQDQLAQALQDRDAHWKSLNHPSALTKFAKMLGRDLRFTKKSEHITPTEPIYGQSTIDIDGEKVPAGAAYEIRGPQTPEQVKARKEAQQLESAGPLSPEEQGQISSRQSAAQRLADFNADMALYDKNNPDAVGPNATPEAKQARQDYANELVQKSTGVYQKPNNIWLDLPDGSVQMFDKDHPELFPPGSRPHVNETTGNKSLEQYNKGIEDGTIPAGTTFLAWESSQRSANKMTAGQLLQDSYLATIGLPYGTPWESLSPQQRFGFELYKNKLAQRSTNHQTAVTDRDGKVHLVDLTSISGPVYASAPQSQPTTSSPTPQDIKKKAGPLRPQSSKGMPTKADIVLNFKKSTPDYTKAKNTYNDAERISKLSDRWFPLPSGQRSEADANFVLTLIRSEAGRVNQQEIGQMFNAGGIAEAPERWAAKAGHGELPEGLRKQLFNFVHMQRDAAKDVLDEMDSSGSPSGQNMTDDEFLMKVK